MPLAAFINLRNTKGKHLIEVENGSSQWETFDLTDLFTKPLLSKYGIVILGDNRTTGYGKTQFAKRLTASPRTFPEMTPALSSPLHVTLPGTSPSRRATFGSSMT